MGSMRPSARRALHHFLPHSFKPASSAARAGLRPLAPDSVLHSTATVTQKKSVFVGHAARVRSVDEAVLALQHVLSQKKVSKATHNILAYRISTPSDESLASVQEGSDCDGEPPAGKNLLDLLRKVDAKDVMVVVTRWYGGVPMGPDRFRVINAVGKEALEMGGFVSKASTKPAKRTKKR